MESYGLGAVALIGLAFFVVHRVDAFLVASGAIIGAFTVITNPLLPGARSSEWCVMTAGLLASAFGLTIVRVMLIRSVSLQLLERIDRAGADSFEDDVSDRLDDMRTFRLVRRTNHGNMLTPFGQLIGAVAAASYRALRIDL